MRLSCNFIIGSRCGYEYSIKPSHGLGNLVLLLPVLEAMEKESVAINIVTQQMRCDLFGPMFAAI